MVNLYESQNCSKPLNEEKIMKTFWAMEKSPFINKFSIYLIISDVTLRIRGRRRNRCLNSVNMNQRIEKKREIKKKYDFPDV